MRFIKKQLSLWRIALIISVAAIAIPIAARVSPTATAIVNQGHENLAQPNTNGNEDANANHIKDSKAAVGEGVAWWQDDYYDRRREYWEKRVERRLDREEDLDDNDADAKDSKSGEDKKDAKADKDDGDDEDDSFDQEEERIERRREYWRQRLDKEW